MGKMHLRLAHTVMPSWITRLTEVKGSYRKAEESLKDFVGLSPTGLARAVSLKRANARAKAHHRLENPGDEYVDPHWSCQSIDALYVKSQMKEEYGLDWTKPRKEEDSTVLSLCIEDSIDSNGEVEVEDHGLEDKRIYSNLEVEVEDHGLEDKRIDDVGIEGTRSMVMGGRRSKKIYGATKLSDCLPSHIANGSVKNGVAVVKYSYNPYKDFRESMLQMIVETNMGIKDSDLEELLYCYFSLNSPELHDYIESAFADILIEVQAALMQF